MGVEPGSTLAHHHIVEKIGERGTGVVWRARDATLDRDDNLDAATSLSA